MRCPKCHYISFDSNNRCRNCGYEFSLAPGSGEIDLPIQTGDEAIGPLSDFPLDTPAPSDSSDADGASEGELAGLSSTAGIGADRTTVAPSDLPLFKDRALWADAPLGTPPAVPRAPLSVRRAAPAMARGRQRATSVEPSLNLEMPDVPERMMRGAPGGRPIPVTLEDDQAATIEMKRPPAAVGRRLLAASVDGLLLVSIDASVLYFTLKVCGLQFAEAGVLPAVPLAAYLLLLDGGYSVAFTAAGGQTMGKMAAGIKVVPSENSRDATDRVPLGQAALRAAACLVSALPVGLGFLPALFRADRRALHDWLAATRVVKA